MEKESFVIEPNNIESMPDEKTRKTVSEMNDWSATIEPLSKTCSLVHFSIFVSNKLIGMINNGDKAAVKAVVAVIKKSLTEERIIEMAREYIED